MDGATVRRKLHRPNPNFSRFTCVSDRQAGRRTGALKTNCLRCDGLERGTANWLRVAVADRRLACLDMHDRVKPDKL